MNLEVIALTLIQALNEFEAALHRLNPLSVSQIRDWLLGHATKLAGARDFVFLGGCKF